MAAGLPPPALPSLYASCVRAAGLTAGAPTGSTWWISPGGTGTCTGWRWGPTRRSISWTTWKSTVTSRAEQSVPLLLHSLPVWGRFTSGGDFSFFIVVTHPSFRFSKGGRENRPATEYFSFPYDKNRLSMTIPASVPVALASHGFFPYIRTDI